MTFDFDPDDYRSPHCNEQVLHAPGECEFCDKYPERQQARIASGTPFSPNEQPWPGNQAGGYGDFFSVPQFPPRSEKRGWRDRMSRWIRGVRNG